VHHDVELPKRQKHARADGTALAPPPLREIPTPFG
jgi:hypothetical protein